MTSCLILLLEMASDFMEHAIVDLASFIPVFTIVHLDGLLVAMTHTSLLECASHIKLGNWSC